MSEKRFTFYYERGNEVVIEDNGKRLSNKKVVDLLNEQQATISALKEENEQLKEEIRAYPINEQYAEEIIQQNQKLRIERNDLRRKNEQLKQKLENLDLNEKKGIIKKIDGKVFIRM